MTTQRRVGAYAKLLANYAADDALIAAGEAAELLFVRGLAFCATSDADGYITDAQVVRYVGAGMRDAMKRAERLVEVGVWDRVAGGFQVRSWLRIHESAEQRGRRRKADRERKAKGSIQPDSVRPSARIPDGIQTEHRAESLSMNTTRQEHDSATTRQDNSEELREQRPVTLHGTPETEHSSPNPANARCTAHQGVADPGPCNGCRLARERAERKADAAAEQAARQAQYAAIGCTRCDGTWVVDDKQNPTRHKCNHEQLGAVS